MHFQSSLPVAAAAQGCDGVPLSMAPSWDNTHPTRLRGRRIRRVTTRGVHVLPACATLSRCSHGMGARGPTAGKPSQQEGKPLPTESGVAGVCSF